MKLFEISAKDQNGKEINSWGEAYSLDEAEALFMAKWPNAKIYNSIIYKSKPNVAWLRDSLNLEVEEQNLSISIETINATLIKIGK